jgi:hypothetical protein
LPALELATIANKDTTEAMGECVMPKFTDTELNEITESLTDAQKASFMTQYNAEKKRAHV